MSNYTIDNDIIIDVYRSSFRSLATGFDSIYSSIVHPGSNKRIQGWQWDKRTWPDQKELEALQYSSSIWDPVSNFLDDSFWQSGIGDNNDLLLFEVLELSYNDLKKWIPKICHGYFYEYNEEYYLFSDDYLTENFYNNQTYSGLQYLNLSHTPKVGTPIKARRYIYDRTNQRYDIDLDFRKRVQFTGRLDEDNIEFDTLNDEGNVSFENVHSGNPEFIVDYNNRKVWLNDDYSDSIADSGDFQGYELLGVGDGYKNRFFTKYSPIDPSGYFEVVTYASSGIYTTWNQIDNLLDFTEDGSYEYKLDPILGVVSFGNYDGITGSGLVPSLGSKIIARYTKGVALEYEPQYSRDYILGLNADINPLHTSFEEGILFVGLDNEVPASISLSCDLSQNLLNQYQVNINGVVGKVTATVKSNKNNLLSYQTVYFENIEPATSSVSPADTLTNTNGEAYSYISSLSDIDSIGYLTTDITHSGSNSIINVSGLRELTNESGVLLFGITREDLVLATPSSGEDDYYLNFLNGNGVYVNPSAADAQSQAGIDFEKSYRQQFGITEVEFIDDTDVDTLGVGRKEVIYTNNPNHIHPHSGSQYNPTYSPIFPVKYTSIGTSSAPEMELVYNEIIEPLNDKYKSFLVAAEALDYIRAYVINPLTGQRIYSNIIEINIGFDDSSDGIINCEGLSDIPSGLYRGVRSMDYYGDDWIVEATSGELYDTYLEQKLTSGEFVYSELGLQDNTVALYHFDNNLEDSGPNSLDAEGEDYIFAGNAGYSNEALYIIGSGGNIESDQNVFHHFPINSGTLEFAYRTPWIGYNVADSISSGYMFSMLYGDSASKNNGIEVFTFLDGGTSYFGVDYIASGLSCFALSPSDFSVDLTDSNLSDGAWHQIKLSWQYIPDDVTPDVGSLNIYGYIDNVGVIEKEDLDFGSVPSPFMEYDFNLVERDSVLASSQKKVIYQNGFWVSCGGGVQISTDTINWIDVSPPGTNLRSVAYGNGLWVAVGDSNDIWISSNLYNWTERVGASTLSDCYFVSYGNGIWHIGGYEEVQSSSDTVTWSKSASTINGGQVMDIKYGGGNWFLLTEYSGLHKSTDGLTWIDLSVSTDWTDPTTGGLGYGNNTWIVAQGQGYILRSTDNGLTFHEIYPPQGTYQNAYYETENARWVILSSNNLYIHHSNDNGDTWSTVSGVNGGLYDVVFNNKEWLFVGNDLSSNALILYSSAGLSNIVGRKGRRTILGYYDEVRLTSGENIVSHTFQSRYNLESESYPDWFRRTRILDSKHLGLDTHLYSGSCPSTVPVGFRLKSNDTDVASVVGHRTFLDLNDSLPNDYYLVSGLDIYERYY
jgi:hypothetical protein